MHLHSKAGGVAQQQNTYMFKAMSLISQNEKKKLAPGLVVHACNTSL